MLAQFRKRYPHGSLISELVQIDRNQYIVKALVQVEGITLATGLSAADTVEQAEEQAIDRALARLDLSETNTKHPEIEEVNLRSPAKLSEPIVEKREKIEPQKVVSPSVEHSDRAEIGNVTSDYRSEFTLSQDKVESTEVLPLLSNGVASAKTIDAVPAKTQLEFPEETSEPDEPITPQPSPEPKPSVSSSDLSFEDIVDQTNIHIKRLGWTNEQGRQYLLQAYGKRSRQLLNDEELLQFLQYLESQPSP